MPSSCFWGGEDWTPCFRDSILNEALPLATASFSLLIILVRVLSSRKRAAISAGAVAKLDPEASSFALPPPRAAAAEAPRETSQPALTKAELLVYRTENAVILNEVLQTPLHVASQAQVDSDARAELAKRLLECIGSVIMVALHSVTVPEKGWAWVVFWIYIALISCFTLTSKRSFFTHKALLIFVADLCSLSELRTALLSHSGWQLTAAQLAVGTLLVVPTLVAPLHSKPPQRLRAIHSTMRAKSNFAINLPGTVMPSPRAAQLELDEEADAAHTIPPSSISHLPGGPEHTGPAPTESTALLGSGSASTLIPSPETRASLLSRMTFGFATPAIVKHKRIQFTPSTVPDLPPSDHAASVVAAFRAGPENVGARKSGDYDELAPSEGALSWRLLYHFAPLLMQQQVYAVVAAVSVLTPSIGLRLVLGYVAERDAQRAGALDDVTPFHMAILYVVGMAAGQVIASVTQSQALFVGRRICIHLRAILAFEIINKALRRRDTAGGKRKKEETEGEEAGDEAQPETQESEAEAYATDGEVQNLLSVDVFKVAEIGAYLHFLWPQAPVEIGLAVFLLVKLLGISAIVGLTVLVFAMPLQAFAAGLFVRVQKALLAATDERLNLTTEVLSSIKTVKFFAWEESMKERLLGARAKELRVLRRRAFAWILSALTFFGSPMLCTLFSFAFHTRVLHRPLPAEVAFTALTLFNALRNPLEMLPDMVVQCLSTLVSLRRIDRFLREKSDTGKYEQARDANDPAFPPNTVGFKDASFTYSESDEDIKSGQAFVLEVDAQFPVGEFSIVVGGVGSGKTTLLLALLGEARRLSGYSFMPCPVARALVDVDPVTGLSETVAYCPQSPWLVNATVRENILFGDRYDERRYKAVTRACALEPDLKNLEYGDETEVGEKGTALSGGQKARIALARAIYSRASYIVLDDVLAAVDAHTAKHLYEQCFGKSSLMQGRTVILVTHAVALTLPSAAFVVVLNDGRVVAKGTPVEVRASGQLDDELTTAEEGSEAHEETTKETVTIEELDEGARAAEQAEVLKRQEKKALHSNEETYGKGGVGINSYILYLGSFAATRWGIAIFWLIALVVFLGVRGLDVGSAAWLRRWASLFGAAKEAGRDSLSVSALVAAPTVAFRVASQGATRASTLLSAPFAWFEPPSAFPSLPLASTQQFVLGASRPGPSDDLTAYYLSVYALFILGYVTFAVARDALSIWGALQASRRLYERMLQSVLLAPALWFDRTPLGRIMNRFSKDIETIDLEVASNLIFFTDVCLQTLGILLIATYAVPAFILAAILVILATYAIGSLYIVSSRDLKRIESVQRSPLFTLIGEVLNGAVVIRAFGDASRFTRSALRSIDKSNRPFFFLWYCNRWLSIRVDAMATVVTLGISAFIVSDPNVDAALAGFTLSFSIQLVESVLWVLRTYTTAEINANSIERIDEYLHLPQERQGGIEPPAAWPTDSASIRVENLVVRYSPELQPALKSVSFEIQAGQKVGIVGRTGSGKSTLALALFRFLEADEGRILVDGIDIATVPLRTLRERLTVIPQSAELFSGTVRSNLDPFNRCADTELWTVLIRCQLASPNTPAVSRAVSRVPSRAPSPTLEGDGLDDGSTMVVTSLEMEIAQGGKNLSAGQRQLLALARGLLKLRESPILILDESTASLDAAADAAIQRTLRSEQAGKKLTTLCVAHRLRSVIDYDRILVLGHGEVLEYASPSELLRRKGTFHDLCAKSGEYELLVEMAEKAEASSKLA